MINVRQYEKQIQILQDRGMFYRGMKKFCWKGRQKYFFQSPDRIVNTFGYYDNGDSDWVAFVTDEERGIEQLRKKVSSEENAIKYLIELSTSSF